MAGCGKLELKKYQRAVLAELRRYVEAYLKSGGNVLQAWQEFWEFDAPEKYRDRIGGAADICVKVPTGGGKTFIACAALAEIFGILPRENKIVVWLVPSEAILTQTVAALQNPAHAYRQRLEKDFGRRVEICTKEMLLQGQNFTAAAVSENLTVCVLSYDSFRSRTKDSRKVYQENGALFSFAEKLGVESSLMEILRALKPVVIVDESHNAGSELSVEMLANLSPSFVLELTATPREYSNVIYSASANELKAEQMIKLPVIIYPPRYKGNFLAGVVEFRALPIWYIRPIALIQAQADTRDDSETFDKIKNQLIGAGIPAEQIAIKTSSVNELKDKNLLSRDCKIRYIITVNALKEGWDCPFAYILASLANKNSSVDVEQIVGRILRQPYAESNSSLRLNACYVFSDSGDFQQTVKRIADGLNGEGLDPSAAVPAEENSAPDSKTAVEDIIDRYNEKSRGTGDGKPKNEIKPKFSGSVEGLKIPQFFQKIRSENKNDAELLSAENLSTGFNLSLADAEINFDLDIQKIDVDETGRYVVGGVSMAATAEFQKFIDSRTPEVQAEYYVGHILGLLKRFHRMKTVDTADLKNYIRRVVGGMSGAEREGLKIDTAFLYAEQIKSKIYKLEARHRRKKFDELIGAAKIFCKKSYSLSKSIEIKNSRVGGEKSLYPVEGDMNNFEAKLIGKIAAQENVTWWHRNIERRGFYLNGWLNHYPDFIVRLDSGKIILVEAKGSHLDGDDSREKLTLGNDWAARAGENYRYFMVFDEDAPAGKNSCTLGKFISAIGGL